MASIYEDFDMSFKKHPLSQDIAILSDEAAIKNSLRNLLRLNKYDKPFSPGIYSPLYEVLFEPLDRASASILEVNLSVLIPQYETRISNLVIQVIPHEDDNKYEVVLQYTVIKSQSRQTLQVFLPVERLK